MGPYITGVNDDTSDSNDTEQINPNPIGYNNYNGKTNSDNYNYDDLESPGCGILIEEVEEENLSDEY